MPAEHLFQWATFYEEGERQVAFSKIEQPEHDVVHVTTLFIGLDMRLIGDGPPLLFETMVIGGPLDAEIRRYSTWEEAEAGHHALVAEATLVGKVSAAELREQLQALANKDKKEQQ